MITIITIVQGNLLAVLTAVAAVLASLLLLKYGSRAPAAFRIAGKESNDIIDAAKEGDLARLRDHMTVDASRVHVRD